jgi:hypothetical protein
MRRLPPLLPLLLLAASWLAASPARAEEVVVLDNGAVLMGSVVREDANELTLRLAGTTKLALVTLDKAQVTQRIRTSPQRPRPTVADAPVEPAPLYAPTASPPVEIPEPAEVPAEEPSIAAEGFFERLARVTVMSLPTDVAGRVSLAVLLLLALLALVGLGARLAEIETLTFLRGLLLAGILGAMLVADILLRHEVLRADRARWILPAEAAGWLGAAVLVLREGVGRTILLFAFVLFSVSVVVFTAGAILVTF